MEGEGGRGGGEQKVANENNSNQLESSEPTADEPGTSAGSGRFYECIFCRRGFTTAQALGGHMNIHRRDRPRIRTYGLSSPSPRRLEDPYHPYSRGGPRNVVESSTSNYVVYFPVSGSAHSGGREEVRPEMPSADLAMAGEELHLGLNRLPRPVHMKDSEVEKEEMEGEDLDLELRLGYSMPHECSDL